MADRPSAHEADTPSPGQLRRLPIILFLLALAATTASALLPQTFHQDETGPLAGLVGTSMSDVVWSGQYLWVAT
ncbi:MAG: hypothetical protein HN404_26415, partial [Gemmatimonadetes bacterium]|nr:hypothetical protein [Gemmatimonadota bacterium]